MTYDPPKRNKTFLCFLVLVAGTYLLWQVNWPWYSGNSRIDGAAGIILGLFICSRPAANGIDLFFSDRLAFRQLVSTTDGFTWFLLNGLVMLVGWLVISVGASRLTA